MASGGTLVWIDRLVWTFIYGGLFTLILGLAALPAHAVASWSLIAVGTALVVAGVVLIWVRARLTADR
jgi:hypothetical protein